MTRKIALRKIETLQIGNEIRGDNTVALIKFYYRFILW
jgi:hypothetical protein